MANLLRQIISIETFLNNCDNKIERILTKGQHKPIWRNAKLNIAYDEVNAKVFEAEYTNNVEILNYNAYIASANEWYADLNLSQKTHYFWYLPAETTPTINQIIFEFLK
ncbi:hypothetical protein MA9V1_010 [Chryseobacterium phage MA9V-1]|nr:hypothetical protein MA9V1_010 [Chryseobacterium phage MA9V-1]